MFIVSKVLVVAVICTVPGVFAAPRMIGEMKGPRVTRETTDGNKEKGDFLSTVATAANAAKLVAVPCIHFVYSSVGLMRKC